MKTMTKAFVMLQTQWDVMLLQEVDRKEEDFV